MNYVKENIDLKELFDKENISIRSRNVCEFNRLSDIDSIFKFYFENQSFKDLRNCGNNSNEELIVFCEKYKNLSWTKSHSQKKQIKITVNQLFLNKEISMRSKNSCKRVNLETLEDIVKYYRQHGTFKKIRNCGNNSNDELIELCHKYEKSENPIAKQIDTLTVRQKKILNNLIESQSNGLSVRSLNAIEKFSNSNLTIRGFKELLIDPRYDLRRIKNIGEKSVDELVQFFKEIREQIEIIQLFENDDELTIELFNTYLHRKFDLKSSDIAKIWNNYNSENGLPVFKTVDTLISNGYLFKEKELEIFKRGFNFWTDSLPEKLENIAPNIRITRERTRQIRRKLLDEINSKFAFLKALEFDALNLYGLDINTEIILVDNDLVEEIQQKESVSCNNIFITKILSILLNKTHTLIGDIESCTFNSPKPKGLAYRWNSIYLVKKEVENSFNFESLAIDINRRLSDRIEEDYSFHFETYLISFQKEILEIDFFVIVQIAEHIIFNEFEISIDTFDQIIFRRNTKKQVIEYVYDILKEKNKPLDIYQIYNILVSKHPNVTKSAEALRGSCQRDPNLICFGRSSIYGLHIWEKDESIKGGTMHDIAEEFLIQFEIPKHIDKITEYVSQYRPSVTSKNLLYNLKSAENRRFIFFKNYHIGLIKRQYNEEFIRNDNSKIVRRTWEVNFKLLSNFTNDFNRLPFSSGNKEEQKLYRFMNIQLNKASKNKVEQSKIDKINKLVAKYDYIKRARRNPKNLDSSYIKLAQFIKTNNRLPNARNEDERKLYHFYYRQTKQYDNGELTPEQESKYIETKELIRDIYGN